MHAGGFCIGELLTELMRSVTCRVCKEKFGCCTVFPGSSIHLVAHRMSQSMSIHAECSPVSWAFSEHQARVESRDLGFSVLLSALSLAELCHAVGILGALPLP